MRKKVKVARYTVKLLIRPHSDLKAKEKKQDTQMHAAQNAPACDPLVNLKPLESL